MTTKFGAGGTVLVYRSGQWGYICSDRWTDVEAETVCQSEGFELGVQVQSYANDGYPFLVHNVTCGLTDTTLEDCSFQDVRSDVCTYSYSPASVACYNTSDIPVYSLYHGNESSEAPNYGYVHVTIKQEEGQLCAFFNAIAYKILCKQLGFIDGELYDGDLPQEATRPDLPFWVNQFNYCEDDDDSLLHCQGRNWQKDDGYILGSSNKTRPSCYTGQPKAYCYGDTARTSMGFGKTSGILEIPVNGNFYHVCVSEEDYTQQAADVVCHQLTGSSTSAAIRINTALFDNPQGQSVAAKMACNGSEQRLEDCMSNMTISNSSYCPDGLEAVAVICYEGDRPTDAVSDWAIQRSDSAVLVKRFGLWGHICSSFLSYSEAIAICQAAGYHEGYVVQSYGRQRLPTWVQSIQCPDNARGVDMCSITMMDYNHTQAVQSCDRQFLYCY